MEFTQGGADFMTDTGIPANVKYFEGLIQSLDAHLYICQNASALVWNVHIIIYEVVQCTHICTD